MSAISKQEQLPTTPWILATRFRYAGTLLNDRLREVVSQLAKSVANSDIPGAGSLCFRYLF